MNSTEVVILLVDDSPDVLAVLGEVLAPLKHRIKVATSGERALQIAQTQPPDLILLDVLMPGIDGFETCRHLQADPTTRDIPVLFVTADHANVARGFEVGGVDYIPKPFEAVEVRARVSHQLERLHLHRELLALNAQLEERVRERTAELAQANSHLRREVNERRFMQDRLQYLATHDFVTRLYNRSALDQRVCEVLARRRRERVDAAFLMIDLDQFRLVNDTLGCVAGDELLHQLAEHLGSVLNHGDFFARIGADQFAVLIEGPEGQVAAHRQAQALNRHLDHFVFTWDHREHRVSATIAVVPITDDTDSFEQVMLMAEDTIQVARQSGTGQVLVYQKHRPELLQQRDAVNWAMVLVDALRDDHLRIHFQHIQANNGAGRMHIELLMRLWDPVSGRLIFPGRFIPPAERFKLIADLDRWMLRSALAFLGRHRQALGWLGEVSINLSAVSLRDPALAVDVLDWIDEHQVPAHLLCFEITETEAIANMDAAKVFMQRLAARGCRFAMDDFGTGYASYHYLRELPFDVVKIDGVFVRDMDVDPSHAAMVASMVEMLHLLDKPVVAECVENAGVVEQLGTLGVEQLQGYHFHKPEPLTLDALSRLQRAASSPAQVAPETDAAAQPSH